MCVCLCVCDNGCSCNKARVQLVRLGRTIVVSHFENEPLSELSDMIMICTEALLITLKRCKQHFEENKANVRNEKSKQTHCQNNGLRVWIHPNIRLLEFVVFWVTHTKYTTKIFLAHFQVWCSPRDSRCRQAYVRVYVCVGRFMRGCYWCGREGGGSQGIWIRSIRTRHGIVSLSSFRLWTSITSASCGA